MKYLDKESGTYKSLNFVIPSNLIPSNTVQRIEAVETLPAEEEDGVLYVILGTKENLYPNQLPRDLTESGITITFNDKQVSFDGTATASVWYWTKHFTMPIVKGRTYSLQLTELSGSADDTQRKENADEYIGKITLAGYTEDAPTTEDPIVSSSGVEYTLESIFEPKIFVVEKDYITYSFSIQIKNYMICNNWTLGISITEV